MSYNNFNTQETQREYFNAQYFNQSNASTVARYETTLLKPFFLNPDKWKLCINRASVPLSMPLSHNNIPFNGWEVGFSFNGESVVELVPQINQKSIQYPE